MPRKSLRSLAATALMLLLALSFTAIAVAADSVGAISFTSAAYQVDESAGTASVTLSRSGGSDGTVTAKVTLADGTTSPADYQLAPGALDLSFNAAPKPNNTVRAVIQQPDGKIVIGGSFTNYGGVARAGIARLNGDGTLDTSFVPPAVNGTDVYALALLPSGKVLVGGLVSHMVGAGAQTGITRLNADGTTDASFNPGTGTGNAPVTMIELLPDGKFFIAGSFTTVNGSLNNGLARLNADGNLDSTFNAGAGPHSSPILSLLPLPDGKLLVGGGFSMFAQSVRPGLVRLNDDGKVDTAYNPSPSVGRFYVEALALEANGKVLVGGGFWAATEFNGTDPTSLVRLNQDGSLDDTFLDPGLGKTFRTNVIARQADGKLIVGGSTLPGLPNYQTFNGFARLNADGSQDPTFKLGIAVYSSTSLEALAVQPDGRILVGGRLSLHPFGEPYAYLMRLEGDLFVTWGAGDSADKTVKLPIVNDTLAEEDETLNLTLTPLTGGAAAGSVTNATLSILDDDGALQFSSPTYSVGEGAGSIAIPVTRTGGTSVTSSVTYAVSTGSAIGGVDFTPSTGTLTFAPGETSKNISVPILDDSINELNESVSLTLGVVTGAKLGANSRAVLTILDDDPLPTLSVNDVTVTEGDTGAKQVVFTVTRTGLTSRSITFMARTSDGTAVAGEDYASVNSSYFMSQSSAQTSTTTVSVSVLGDTLVEPDKNFFLDISSPDAATVADGRGECVIKDNDTTTGVPTVQFAAREFTVSEGAGVVKITLTRSGDTSVPTNVNYVTSFGGNYLPASDRSDYAFTQGTLSFAAGEDSKSFDIFITDDALVEKDESFDVYITSLTGGVGSSTLGTPPWCSVHIIDNDTAATNVNPADDSQFFVRQHYRDFLNRDPDAAGLQFWTNEVEKCGQDSQCREIRRINVSAAFFQSIEFQQTGYFVYLLNKAAFNTGERLPFMTFQRDSQLISKGIVVGEQGWEQKLSSNKQAFADAFVQRPEFTSAFPSTMTPAQFVDALNANTGDPLNPTAGVSLTQGERDQLVADLTAGAKTRAQALRAVAENGEFQRRQNSKAFVLMQYFGYLRRAPNDTPDTNFDGYNFWLGKLNQFGGNFVAAEMVKAFISSDEYRHRFGQ